MKYDVIGLYEHNEISYDKVKEAFKTSDVAVSTGLMQGMTRPQIRAVLAHEVSHIRNGDMVTMVFEPQEGQTHSPPPGWGAGAETGRSPLCSSKAILEACRNALDAAKVTQ